MTNRILIFDNVDYKLIDSMVQIQFIFLILQVQLSQCQDIKTVLYKTWVCLNKTDGWVLTGNFTCMVGLSSCCRHVAVHLFELEAAVHFKLNEPAACTSQLCPGWHLGKMSVQLRSVQQISPDERNIVSPAKIRPYTCRPNIWNKPHFT